MDKWECRFLDLAEHVADWSKDPRTKVGAVIADGINRIVGLGFNGFPRGVVDSPELYQDRETKYSLVTHAEVNAVLNSNKSVEGCSLYLTLPPCNECAKVIIQAGITDVHHYNSDRINETSMKMFEQSGVKVHVHRRGFGSY